MRGVSEKGVAIDPNKVCGATWFHKLTAEERRAVTRAAEKERRKQKR